MSAAYDISFLYDKRHKKQRAFYLRRPKHGTASSRVFFQQQRPKLFNRNGQALRQIRFRKLRATNAIIKHLLFKNG